MTAIPFLTDWTLRSAALIVLAELLLRAFRIKEPAIRLASCTAILFASLAIPALTTALPPLALPIGHAAAPPPSNSSSQPTLNAIAAPPAATPIPTAATSPTFDWQSAALTLYCLTAAALLIRLATGLLLTHRLRRCSLPTTLAPDILESPEVASPVVIGVLRPAIILPSDWREWSASTLAGVLAHERGHLRRRDPMVQLFSRIHRALLWHNPLVWFLHRQIIRAAEECSDDAAVAATRDPATYAATLLDFMQRGGARWQGVAMARYGLPESRIDRILSAVTPPREITRRSFAAIFALASPLAFVIATAHPQAKPVPPHKDTLTFEAASVKPTTIPDGVTIASGGRMSSRKGAGIRPPRNTGGPGTNDPGRIHFELVTLKHLLDLGWKSYYEVKAPDWLESVPLAVDASMPPSTTESQFQEMLRTLITERFALQFHIEAKEIPGYVLTVAKDGLKMKPSTIVPDAPPVPPSGVKYKRGSYGFPDFAAPLPPGPFNAEYGSDYGTRIVCQWCDAPKLANTLHRILNAPVTESTALTGKYDYTLTFAGDPPPGATLPETPNPLPSLFTAVQSQLGLKLDRARVSVETMVVDHIDKTPRGN
jgi:uncharacterized protein (TIGR03435 family)